MQLIKDSLERDTIHSNKLQITELTGISNSTKSDLSKTNLEFTEYKDNQSKNHGNLEKKIDAQMQKINDLEEKLTVQASAETILHLKINSLQDELELLTHKNRRAIQQDRKILEKLLLKYHQKSKILYKCRRVCFSI